MANQTSADQTSPTKATEEPSKPFPEGDTSPIPLDITDPRCPREVIYSLIADAIRYQYNETKIEPHPMLEEYLAKYPEGRGHDWEQRVMDGLTNQPIELIERWVNNGLPVGFFRAECRAYLNQRKSEANT